MVNVPEAAGRGAGGFLGGLFNNPGVVILGGLAIALVFFSGDIRKAFGSLGESIGSIGDIELPDITLPTINFPEINIDFPDFSAAFQSLSDRISAGFAGLGTIGGTTVSPTMPPDVPTDIPPTTLPDGGLGDVDIPPSVLDPSGMVTSETPPTFDASQFVTEEELQARLDARDAENIPDLVNIAHEPISLIEETQAQFQERAGAFVQVLPEVTAFTSLPDSSTDFIRRQISRNQQDFQSLLMAEAIRSETIFAGLFGNVQNPDF